MLFFTKVNFCGHSESSLVLRVGLSGQGEGFTRVEVISARCNVEDNSIFVFYLIHVHVLNECCGLFVPVKEAGQVNKGQDGLVRPCDLQMDGHVYYSSLITYQFFCQADDRLIYFIHLNYFLPLRLILPVNLSLLLLTLSEMYDKGRFCDTSCPFGQNDLTYALQDGTFSRRLITDNHDSRDRQINC